MGFGEPTLTELLRSATVELSGIVIWNEDSVDNLIVTFIVCVCNRLDQRKGAQGFGSGSGSGSSGSDSSSSGRKKK